MFVLWHDFLSNIVIMWTFS